MRDLSEHIKSVRGKLTQREFAKKCGLSLRTISGIESNGESLHLRTLQQIRKSTQMSREQWLDLLISWLKLELMDDFNRLHIAKARAATSALHASDIAESHALHLFRQLNDTDQQQIEKVMQRPVVMECLRSINNFWDEARSEAATTPKTKFDEHLSRQGNDGNAPQDLSAHKKQLTSMRSKLANAKK